MEGNCISKDISPESRLSTCYNMRAHISFLRIRRFDTGVPLPEAGCTLTSTEAPGHPPSQGMAAPGLPREETLLPRRLHASPQRLRSLQTSSHSSPCHLSHPPTGPHAPSSHMSAAGRRVSWLMSSYKQTIRDTGRVACARLESALTSPTLGPSRFFQCF